MFWRQIPRATDVLSNRNPETPPPFLRSQSSPTTPLPEAEQPRPSYSSRSATRDSTNWEKAIRGVMSEERQKNGGMRHVSDVVEAAVAVDKEKKKGLKGLAVRLRRRSSAANLRPPLDLEDDSPDPITLARITPFAASPPASLVGGSRDDSDSSNGRRTKKIDSTRPSSSFVEEMRRQLPQSTSAAIAPPTRPPSVPPPRRAPTPASSDDDDDESTLPPYEPSDRFASRPPPPHRSATSFNKYQADYVVSMSRPTLDRRSTVAAPVSYVPLPPLPPPPPIAFSSSRLQSDARIDDDDERHGDDTSDPIPYQARQIPSPSPSRRLSRRRSSASIRRRPDRIAYHELYGMSGLANLGNSCYLSAVIQSLAATDLLSVFLSSGEYRQEINRNNRNGSQGQIAEALSVLFGAMSSGKHRVITAGRFRDIISSASRFDNYDQQDAHDFLLYLLDAIHEDLNLVTNPSPIRENTARRQAELEELPEVIAADQEWAAYREQNDSIVIDFFQGQLRNRMECLYCHETSTTFNPLQTLPLPIPDQQGDIPVQLEDCIDEFLREEILEDDNAWHCPRCRCPRTASKQLTITRLPQILIIQLKRFTSYSSFTSKNETPVDFPIDQLELGYLLPSGSTSKKHRLNLPHELNTNYELYALVNHLGGENTSDTTIVRKNETFLEIDDEIIATVPASEIVGRFSSSAYLLLYRLADRR